MKTKTILQKRLEKEGYESVTDFVRRSGCPSSPETIRLAIYEGKDVSVPSLMMIMKYLGFTPGEIRAHLEEMGEKEFSSLLASDKDGGTALAGWESTLLAATRKIRDKSPVFWNSLAAQLSAIADSVFDPEDKALKEDVAKLVMKTAKK